MKPWSAAVVAAFVASAHAAPEPARLPVINDDYAKARADAAARHVPIFTEVWAPW